MWCGDTVMRSKVSVSRELYEVVVDGLVTHAICTTFCCVSQWLSISLSFCDNFSFVGSECVIFSDVSELYLTYTRYLRLFVVQGTLCLSVVQYTSRPRVVI